MRSHDELIRQALEAERLMTLVSYEPDREKLSAQAAQLRAEAARLKATGRATPRDG